MAKQPIVYETRHHVAFSELDPFQHLSTGNYARYFTDHRMEALAKYAGWDLSTLGTLGFMTWIRRMEISFRRPVNAEQELTITSFVREFHGPDAIIECTMADAAGTTVATCLMIVAHVDATTRRATDWPDDLRAIFFEAEH
ncbi:acyl-CoA thioesterase [Agromyces humi]|uniref:acyl-CoA thioesterase n=1 Tax=Agromyces humi TaxID=1766800 RepID=UPI00135B5B2F|nr:thioesterase family protein [Agromyces humi]